MATGLDYVTDALREIGILAAGQTPSAEDADDGLTALNDFIDELAAHRLAIYTITRTTWTIASGTSTYSVGSGQTINRARPVYIEKIHYQDTSTDPDTEYQMDPLTDDAYANLSQKDLTSTLPGCWYYNPTYPYGTVILYPVPTSSTLQGVLYAPTAVTEVSSLATELSVPPGYRRMFKKNLALDLCSAFDVTPSAQLVNEAAETLSRVKTANLRLMDMAVDSGALAQDYGLWRRYSIVTGQ